MSASTFPLQPYLGLAQYSDEESALFAGREKHVDACARIIAHVETRILLVHGQTGCGKSSFLRAGLIPGLEKRGFGYLFLRRYRSTDDTSGRPAFIRCGEDPLANLARELYAYLGRPVRMQTALGEHEYVLTEARLGAESVEAFVTLCAEPQRLLEALQLLSDLLPATLVIVLDQVEEVLTLNPPDSPLRTRFFTFLAFFNAAKPSAKLVLSLRKDHSGEFIGLAQLDNSIQADFKVYLLPEMNREEVLTAVKLPTSTADVGGMGAPFERYQFAFATGVAEKIVQDLFARMPSGAILPVMQILCKDLYERACQRPQPWIIDGTLYDKQSLGDCVKRHISNALRSSFGQVNFSPSEMLREERRWRKVLYRLVRYEGDGRVHTGVMDKSDFRKAAKKEGALANPNTVFEGLTRPDVLVLRRITIASVGHEHSDPMCSLGHDIVGLVLTEMRVHDDAAVGVERVRRHRLTGFGVAALLLLGAGVYFVVDNRSHERDRREVIVNNALQGAAVIYQERTGDALRLQMHALDALREGKSLDPKLDLQLRSNLERILASLPRTVALPPGGGAQDPASGRDGLLVRSSGFVSARSDGTVAITRVTDTGVATQRLQARSLAFASDTYMAVSEPFDGCVLILLTSYNEADIDKRFRLVIVRGNDLRGPFGGRLLLNKFHVLAASQQRGVVMPSDGATLVAVYLAGDLVVLTAELHGKQFARTLVVKKELRDFEFFSPGTQLPMDVGELNAGRPVEVRVPPKQFVAGGQLFSAEFDRNWAVPQYLYPLQLSSLHASSLRPANDETGSTWWRRAADVPSVAQCSRESMCTIEFAPNPIPNRLVKLLLSSGGPAGATAGGYSPHLSLGEAQETYIIIDSETGQYEEMSNARLQTARAECFALPAARNLEAHGAAAPIDTPPDSRRPFVDGVVGDLVFGFTHRNSIQAVRLKSGQISCTERLYLSERILEWRFLPADDQLIAISENEFMTWDLDEPTEGRPTEPPSKEALFETACKIASGGLPLEVTKQTSGAPAATEIASCRIRAGET